MNSAKEVDGLIKSLKASGIPLSEAAWEAANRRSFGTLAEATREETQKED